MTICTITKYRKITNDTTSYDGDISDALQSAQKIVEQKTNRFFDYRNEAGVVIQRTERLKVHRNGLMYPKATPVHEVIYPLNTQTAGDAVDSLTSLYIALPGWSWYPWSYWHALITYTGGYETDEMPEDIVQAVAEIAKLSFATPKSLLPIGATSVHVGDVSFSGANLSANQTLPKDVLLTLRTWKRREV